MTNIEAGIEAVAEMSESFGNKLMQMIREKVYRTKFKKLRCSRCNHPITLPGETEKNAFFPQGTEVRLDFGFGSKFDCQCWKAYLCDGCCQYLRTVVNFDVEEE